MWIPAQAVLLVTGLLLPGAALGRALRLPRSPALWFIGSALSLYVTVVVCQLLSIRMNLATLAGGLGLLSLGAWAAGLRRRGRSEATAQDGEGLLGPLSGMGPWTGLYLLAWAGILLRLWHQPLPGPDIEFRWSFLAEQLLARGSLDFYPPRNAGDFLHYFWVESLPPGASCLHAWAYVCAGTTHEAWTAPATLLQIWSLHELIWRTARESGGQRAARLACLAAAACPLLTWSTLLGQETGLTALSVVAIAFALLGWQRTRETRWALLAGIAASLGAATREYGLVFTALAASGLLAGRAGRGAWLGFAVAASPGLVWPIRTWILTGNPFFSLEAGAWFPVNPRFTAWLAADGAARGDVLGTASGWRDLARYLSSYAPTALAGWAWLTWSATLRRETRWAAGAAWALGAVWWVSVPFTNGGLFYSLRVLSPALALGCLAAGLALDRGLPAGSPRSTLLGALVGALFVATLPATFALPLNPGDYRDWAAWPTWHSSPPARTDPLVAFLTRARTAGASPEKVGLVLSDGPGFQRRSAGSGIAVVPLWSPQADALFEPGLDEGTAARRWRESGITHLILTRWQMNRAFMDAHSRWARPPFSVTKIAETPLHDLYSITVRD